MRPDLSEELIRRVIDKWRRENKLAIEIPKSKIIEDVLLRYIEASFAAPNIRDRKRDKLVRRFLKMKHLMRPGYYKSPLQIKHTKTGSLMINNKSYQNDTLISYKGLIQNVKLKTPHLFSLNEFNNLLAEDPETIVLGLGSNNCTQISTEVIKLAEIKGIQLQSYSTYQAVENFNKLLEGNKKVAGYFHLHFKE